MTMSCPYSEEELQEWDSVANPMGEACSTCKDCDCEHWVGSCEDCENYEKWPECGGPYREDPMDELYIVEDKNKTSNIKEIGEEHET